jgi:hypothetical protein
MLVGPFMFVVPNRDQDPVIYTRKEAALCWIDILIDIQLLVWYKRVCVVHLCSNDAVGVL